MQVEKISIDKLIPYANNAKIHTKEQISQIKASITEFGFNDPIAVDENNVIIEGHGRFTALQELDFKEVDIIRLSHLTEVQKKQYILAHNKLTMNTGFNEELLKLELEALNFEGAELELTGFDEKELEELLKGFEDTKEIEEDEVPEVDETKEPYSKLGDIWLLGRHRLMCGDSTDKETVEKLMNGQKADMVFTDPHYNVAFNGRSGKHEVIKNDNLSNKDFEIFINKIIEMIKHIDPKCYYIWCNWNFYGILQNKLEYKSCIVWAKNVFGMGNGYRHQHEFCLFNGKIDEHIKNESDLWEIKKDTNYVHPTQKPVALSVRAFSNHIKFLNILDLFGGSGSTLVGAEQTGRNAYLMELDEKYVDVIVKRYHNLGKDDIKLIREGKEYTWEEVKTELIK